MTTCPDCGARIGPGIQPGWHAVRLVRKGKDVVLVNCTGRPAGTTEAQSAGESD